MFWKWAKAFTSCRMVVRVGCGQFPIWPQPGDDSRFRRSLIKKNNKKNRWKQKNDPAATTNKRLKFFWKQLDQVNNAKSSIIFLINLWSVWVVREVQMVKVMSSATFISDVLVLHKLSPVPQTLVFDLWTRQDNDWTWVRWKLGHSQTHWCFWESADVTEWSRGRPNSW